MENISLLSHFKHQTPGRFIQNNLFKELPKYYNTSTLLGPDVPQILLLLI